MLRQAFFRRCLSTEYREYAGDVVYADAILRVVNDHLQVAKVGFVLLPSKSLPDVDMSTEVRFPEPMV